MPRVKFVSIKLEMFESFCALSAVPRIGEQNAADIPKECGNHGQEVPPKGYP